jgi:hypothetical protein
MNRDSGAIRVFRPKPWLVVSVITAAALFIAGAIFTYFSSGWSLTTIVFIVLAAIGCAGVLEIATSRIRLSDEVIEFGAVWTRKRYAAAQIESVTWASGCGVSLKLSQGGWVQLPDLGYNSQSLTNSVRAWLKRSRKGKSPIAGEGGIGS